MVAEPVCSCSHISVASPSDRVFAPKGLLAYRYQMGWWVAWGVVGSEEEELHR